MKRPAANRPMFALRRPPPAKLLVRGGAYRLARVFKHDFFAATCLYERDRPEAPPGEEPLLPRRIVVKFGRAQGFLGLPGAWIGKLLCDREEGVYRLLKGLKGVPRWVERIAPTTCAIEYVDARPLDHLETIPRGFFDRLRTLLEAVHARGVGYCDTNKRSNILVGPRGEPYLVDYQLAVRRRDDWPWPLSAATRAIVRYVAERDLYTLCKHKRRLCPEELTEEERELSYRRTGLHWLHRKLTKPWRALRRAILGRLYRAGRLESPTADLEDHRQPEKETWRKDAR